VDATASSTTRTGLAGEDGCSLESRTSGTTARAADSAGPAQPRARSDSAGSTGAAETVAKTARENLNMCSAFAHVTADTMRTLTVMLCAFLVALGGLDSEKTDAAGALVVSVIILAIAAYIAYEALLQTREYFRRSRTPGVLRAELTDAGSSSAFRSRDGGDAV